jgi:hypothetical protein
MELKFQLALFSIALLSTSLAGSAAAQPDRLILNYAPSSTEVAGRAPELFAHLRGEMFVVVDPLDARIVIIDGDGRVLGSSTPLSFFPENVREMPDEVVFGSATSAREVAIQRSIDPITIGQLTEGTPAPVPARAQPPVLRRSGSRSLVIVRAAANNRDISVRSVGRGYLADAILIGHDAQGRRYVQSSEIVNTKPAFDVRVFVQRFSPRGQLLEVADVPVAEMDTVPKHFIAVNPGGTATVLVPTETALYLQKLHFRRLGSPVPAAAPTRVPVSATIIPSDRSSLEEPTPVPARRAEVPPTTRDQIIARANAYVTINWTLRDENFQHDEIPNRCVKTEGHYWLRPKKLNESSIGSAFGPMPYNWGGSDTPASFVEKISSGFLAGNVCTCREPQFNQCQVSAAAGVDCSGFVSRSWGVVKHGTSNLHAVARPVNGFSQLRPGDALNKAGSHVRLFVRFKPGPQLLFEVLESATNLRCEGVCRSVYTAAELSRYKPLRYVGLQE